MLFYVAPRKGSRAGRNNAGSRTTGKREGGGAAASFQGSNVASVRVGDVPSPHRKPVSTLPSHLPGIQSYKYQRALGTRKEAGKGLPHGLCAPRDVGVLCSTLRGSQESRGHVLFTRYITIPSSSLCATLFRSCWPALQKTSSGPARYGPRRRVLPSLPRFHALSPREQPPQPGPPALGTDIKQRSRIVRRVGTQGRGKGLSMPCRVLRIQGQGSGGPGVLGGRGPCGCWKFLPTQRRRRRLTPSKPRPRPLCCEPPIWHQ